MYRKGTIGNAEVERQLSEIQTAEDMILATKRIEEKKLATLKLGRQKVKSLEKALAGLRQDIDSYTFEQKQQLVRLIVPGDKEHHILANVDKSLTVNGVIDFDEADKAMDEAASEKMSDLAHYSELALARRY